ncbi:MAG TPA: hypothetical protein VNA69_22355 [Thermoanaerobaculia bacterium]|nr:hypothetical protein [Thermoanaerobaculia bacterium]
MKASNYVALLVGLQLLFSLPLAAAPQTAPATPAKSEAAFSNKDVIKLVKLELGDDVVMAKIKQAADVAFDLTTDGLVQLKQAGVSSRVISAMLEKTTPPASPRMSNEGGSSNQPQFFNGADDVRMVIDDKEIRLPANRGDLSATGVWPVVFTFLDYPGLHARTRIKNSRPTLVIRSEHDPKGYYYLGKLDVNDAEDNNRSLKIEQKAGGFTATTRVIPAGRWHVEYESSQKTPGIWYITPKRDLDPGEYGVVVPGGVLYEFGVD